MSASSSGISLDRLSRLWPCFYPKEQFLPKDRRVISIRLFIEFFKGPGCEWMNSCIVGNSGDKYVVISIPALAGKLPFPDFVDTIKTQPKEVMCTIGLALSYLDSDRQLVSTFPHFVDLEPMTALVEIRSGTVGQLVCIEGYVTKVAPYKPLILSGGFQCATCLGVSWSHFDDGIFEQLSVCKMPNCRSRSLELQRPNVRTTDYQVIKIQEIDNSGDHSGTMPRTLDVEVRSSLVDRCIPGDVVRIVGVVRAMQTEAPRSTHGKNKVQKESGIHKLYIMANSLYCVKRGKDGHRGGAEIDSYECFGDREKVEKQGRTRGYQFSQLELNNVESISRLPGCIGLLVASLCPTIFGQESVKLGLLLALVGGTTTINQSEMKTRSDIHVLVVGDPGLGKSQMLRAASDVATRSVFICGITATTAGLTVALTRDGKSSDMSIEAGALVLADQGLCCIDELDKMSCDAHALLEAMEQQQISIAKAGVVTSLKSRTSVLAAANPCGGHYSRNKTVCENLKLPAALLSRFDLIFILLDRPDEAHDKRVTSHVMHSLSGNEAKRRRVATHEQKPLSDNIFGSLNQRLRKDAEPFTGGGEINTEILRSYLEYAKKHVHPRLTTKAAKILQRLYLDMRANASLGQSIPVTTRHLESLVRLSQARARLELRDEVTAEDAQDVVDLLQESLLDTFTSDTGQVDLKRKNGLSRASQVKTLLSALSHESKIRNSKLFSKVEIQRVAKALKINKDIDSLIDILRTECYLLFKGSNNYQLT